MSFYSCRDDIKMIDNMPVYVKIENYKDILATVADLQIKINDARELLAEIDEIKSQEEAELESWKLGLVDVEEKISNLSSVLSQSQ